MIRNIIAASVFALLLSFTGANAADVGYISTTQNGVALPNNITGTWSNNNGTQPVTQLDDMYTGTLAGNSSITFDFSVTSGTLALYSLTLSGSSQYNVDNRDYGNHTGLYYNGGSQVTLTTNSGNDGFNSGSANGGIQDTSGSYTSDPLVFVTANVTDGGKDATVTITNTGPMVTAFMARLQTEIAGVFADSGFTATYSSTSAVPLPGSMVLFMLGLAALGMFAWKRRA